jgi:hypothetical protein
MKTRDIRKKGYGKPSYFVHISSCIEKILLLQCRTMTMENEQGAGEESNGSLLIKDQPRICVEDIVEMMDQVERIEQESAKELDRVEQLMRRTETQMETFLVKLKEVIVSQKVETKENPRL